MVKSRLAVDQVNAIIIRLTFLAHPVGFCKRFFLHFSVGKRPDTTLGKHPLSTTMIVRLSGRRDFYSQKLRLQYELINTICTMNVLY